MIKTRKQFEERIKKMKEDIWGCAYQQTQDYKNAINDVLKLIEDEGGCFKE